MSHSFDYSSVYCDEEMEYRTVVVYKKNLPSKLLTEYEWRLYGLQMSKGWIHYDTHEHFNALLFKRPIKDKQT